MKRNTKEFRKSQCEGSIYLQRAFLASAERLDSSSSDINKAFRTDLVASMKYKIPGKRSCPQDFSPVSWLFCYVYSSVCLQERVMYFDIHSYYWPVFHDGEDGHTGFHICMYESLVLFRKANTQNKKFLEHVHTYSLLKAF